MVKGSHGRQLRERISGWRVTSRSRAGAPPMSLGCSVGGVDSEMSCPPVMFEVSGFPGQILKGI